MLRGAALRVTRPRLAVLAAVHAHPHADTDSIIGAVRGGSRGRLPPGHLRRAEGADHGGAGATHPAVALGGALRVPGRGQPPPRRVPFLRCHRRRGLRGRRRPLPDRRPTTTASPSTRPRSSTGACAPTAPPQPVVPERHAPIPGRISVSDQRRRCRRHERGRARAGCPVSAGRSNHPTEGGSNRDWWPNQLNLKHPAQAPRRRQPHGRGLRLRRGVPHRRPGRAGQGRGRGA